ncbi:MAG: carbonic anhydrase [Chloroflexota bacterium]|nr:carbonic anhydrase [Chloroflexota bacterium]
MDIIDGVLQANEAYARSFKEGTLPAPPARRLAVVTCMDARIDVEPMLGLQVGDAHIIRNAGGIVTGDILRSLIISHHLLGTRAFLIIQHTDCGMLTFTNNELRERLHQQTGTMAETPKHFHTFRDLETSIREQVRTVKAHPWLPDDLPVRGFIYDVISGRLQEIAA